MRWYRHRFVQYTAILLATLLVVGSGLSGYYYGRFSRLIDARLHGARVRVLPRVFARPFELRQGQALTEHDLVQRLNDLGYAQRAEIARPGEFTVIRDGVRLVPRAGNLAGHPVRVLFRLAPSTVGRAARTAAPAADHVRRLEVDAGRAVADVTLDAPLLSALIHTGDGSREKRRQVPLASIPPDMVHAVLAIEDRRFYEHPGVDPIRSVGALVANLSGHRRYLEGGSTLTQQLVKNFFLTPEKSLRRKLQEQFMALVLERQASKNEILELYLNEVYLGQRGSFEVHGVAEAARLFFGKDVRNLSLAEAATIAGVIQSPATWSPFNNPDRALARRNVVLHAMADAGYIAPAVATRASQQPLRVVHQALETEAPYFVDFVGQKLTDRYPGLLDSPEPVDVYTTLDLNLQRAAQAAVSDGLARINALLARRRHPRGPAQAALIAINPHTGEILALVGGGSYSQSQYDRAVAARRQPGSVFKPFVYLAAFEKAAADGRTDITPATLEDDEPATFIFDRQTWQPENYEGEYDGRVTLRHALAHSLNLATIKLAQQVGVDQVAALWKRLGVGTPPQAVPSIALGVFEATPYEIATAYTIFPNMGELQPLRDILRVTRAGKTVTGAPSPQPRRIARPATTYLVTNMMRSVIDSGTGAGARAAGFALDAAGKTGTTNDLRDAWFAGFTPDLLTVVWVGLDDNQPIGLSGSQAALPIWTAFMKEATAGQPDTPFPVPEGVTFVDIDRDTGKLAMPACPRIFREAFLAGTEPVEACPLHKF